jgi:hypothetical protein
VPEHVNEEGITLVQQEALFGVNIWLKVHHELFMGAFIPQVPTA